MKPILNIVAFTLAAVFALMTTPAFAFWQLSPTIPTPTMTPPKAPYTIHSQPPGSPMKFALVSDGGATCCEWIAAEGEITNQTPDDFAAFLKEENVLNGALVRLNSPGGSLIAGVKLGEMFRDGKFSTAVGSTHTTSGLGWNGRGYMDRPERSGKIPGICASACAYAFLGGVSRAAKGGEIGIHQFYSAPPASGGSALSAADSVSETQAITGLIAQYLKEMGVDPEVLALASVTPSSGVYWPDGPTMAKLRITTYHTDVQFSGWTIEPYRSGAVVTGTVNDQANQKTQLALFCRRSNPGQVYLRASWRNDLFPTINQGASETGNQTSAVLGSKLIIGQTTVREQNGLDGFSDARVDDTGFVLTYPLSMTEFNRGLQAGFEVQVDVPHAYSPSMSWVFQPPLTGLQQNTDIAFKSCL